MDQARHISMRVLRRICAAMILLAFLPASIAAALPLVYCVGANGHHAIEYVGTGSHDHGAPWSASDGASGKASVEHRTCIDFQLTPVAQAAPRDAKAGLASAGESPSPLKYVIPADAECRFPQPPGRRKLAAHGTPGIAIDYLTAHRTIVLLI